MDNVLIVGSGASGVHFALSLLQKGYQVTMLDVGWQKPEPVNPTDTWQALKINLADPVKYFLGEKFESVVYPGAEEEFYTKYYGFPPSKSHVFTYPKGFEYETKGFTPLLSFAQGGLAEAWTGGAYPFNEADLKEYPFSYQDIEPYYSEVAKRIGLIGVNDDMARFFPFHDNLLGPLNLDLNSQYIVDAYEKNKQVINNKYRAFLGRSRVTTQTVDTETRKACTYCGRCLWGCPSESLYTPSLTLHECLMYPNFHYITGLLVTHFEYDAQNLVQAVHAVSLSDGKNKRFSADRYALAAGALSSSKIFMESIFQQTGEIIRLNGLMDNRQILVPFVNLNMLGERYNSESYQYHQLAVGLEAGDHPEEYVHGQITTFKSALVHPVIQNVPFDLHTSIQVFRNVRSGLGVVNLNLFDRRRDTNYVTLSRDSQTNRTKLVINYAPLQSEAQVIKNALKKVKSILWKLRCVVPPGMVHIRPMGASVHYSGTLPMLEEGGLYKTTKYCQSYDFSNLYIVDGSSMPFLPAKNITFTLMANAVRIADSMF